MITLIQTCGACPEQYDAFIGERQVGYLRLRHGRFTVECPDVGGVTVYVGEPDGDGIFTDAERETYLNAAKSAIQAWADSKYEWKAMSEWIAENAPSQGEHVTKTPMDDGWEVVGGALRRPVK